VSEAEGGFVGAPSNDEKRKQREGRRHGDDASLESLDNSESNDDLDADSEVASHLGGYAA
jgi:hypothetical protein